jgi:hypothetical protein
VNASQTLQPPSSCSESGRFRDVDMLVIACYDTDDFPFAGNKNGELPIEFPGQPCQSSGQFLGNNVIGRDLPAVELLQAFLLTGFEPACLAEYLLDFNLLLDAFPCVRLAEEPRGYDPGTE